MVKLTEELIFLKSLKAGKSRRRSDLKEKYKFMSSFINKFMPTPIFFFLYYLWGIEWHINF